MGVDIVKLALIPGILGQVRYVAVVVGELVVAVDVDVDVVTAVGIVVVVVVVRGALSM